MTPPKQTAKVRCSTGYIDGIHPSIPGMDNSCTATTENLIQDPHPVKVSGKNVYRQSGLLQGNVMSCVKFKIP